MYNRKLLHDAIGWIAWLEKNIGTSNKQKQTPKLYDINKHSRSDQHDEWVFSVKKTIHEWVFLQTIFQVSL